MPYADRRRGRAAIVWLSVLTWTVASLVVPPRFGRVYAADDSAPVVGDVRIEGLRRTREAVVRDLIAVTSGDRFSDDLIERIRIALIDSELFASIDVNATRRPAEAGAQPSVDIVITVRERWTLVPIPIFIAGGESVQGGLIVFESNLFGRNKQAVAGGFFSDNGSRGLLGYIDPSIFQTRWSINISTSFGLLGEKRSLPDRTTIREFDYNLLRLNGTIGYDITDDLTAKAGVGYQAVAIRSDRFASGQAALESVEYFIPELQVEWDATRPIGVLRFGPTLELSGRLATHQEGREVAGSLTWGLPLFRTHRFNVLASGGYGAMPTTAETVISVADGYRTLPYRSIAADRWGSVAAYYDYPFLNQRWGALVLSHFWEYGVYAGDAVDPQRFFGPGGSFRVFIRQVAIPALGLNIGYNLQTRRPAVSFTIGAQM